MTIGVVACGYADGYPRHAPTGTPVLVDGVRTRTVGRVSMDMISVDISDIPEAVHRLAGDAVGRGPVRPTRSRAAAGTVGYELLCALTRARAGRRGRPDGESLRPLTSAPNAARPRCSGSAPARPAAPRAR